MEMTAASGGADMSGVERFKAYIVLVLNVKHYRLIIHFIPPPNTY